MVVNQDLPRPYVEPGSRTEIIHARDYHATAAAGTPSPLTKQDHPHPPHWCFCVAFSAALVSLDGSEETQVHAVHREDSAVK